MSMYASRQPKDFLPVAILAGGLATRLRPLTASLPKSMLPVAGEPFIAHQLRWLASEGVSRVVLCTGYLAEQIEAYVGDGQKFGLTVAYSHDGDRLRGTGGALRAALRQLGGSFAVVYGDSYLTQSLGPVFEAFRHQKPVALMTVFQNEGKWDASNVEFSGGQLLCYNKILRTNRMHHIDYGLTCIDAEAIAAWPGEGPFDLADLLIALSLQRRLAGFEVFSRFYEIGSVQGLEETELFLRGQMSQNGLVT